MTYETRKEKDTFGQTTTRQVCTTCGTTFVSYRQYKGGRIGWVVGSRLENVAADPCDSCRERLKTFEALEELL